jgi:outer membrane protein assembly factor BamA
VVFGSRVRRLLPLLLIASLVLPGCAASRKRKAPPTKPIVMAVKVKGGKALKSADITPHLAQRSTSVMAFLPVFHLFNKTFFLDGTTWEKDRVRIANLYALQGYFDARVVGTQLTPSKKLLPNGEPRSVKIFHTVTEGEPSFLRSLCAEAGEEPVPDCGPTFTLKLHAGLPDTTHPRMPELTPQLQVELDAVVREKLPMRPGERFAMEDVDATAKLMTRRLRAKSYSRAVVTSRVDARPEEHVVDVAFDVWIGPPAVFGKFTVQGLSKVRQVYVTRLIKWEEGKPWDGDAVARTQQAVYDLGLFSLVTVGPVPDRALILDVDGKEIVGVQINLKERKPGTVRPGIGIGFQRDRFDVHGSIGLSHLNVFRRLVRGDLYLKGGYKFISEDDHFVVGNFDAALTWPIPQAGLEFFGKGSVDLDVEVGYKMWSPEAEAGVAWSPWKPFRLALSYSLSYVDLFPDDRVAELQAAGELDKSDIEFEDGYFLSRLRQEIILDLRDQPLAASRGILGRVVVEEAGGPIGGTFRYVKLTGDLRGYIPLGTPRLVLAGKAWASWIHVWGEETGVPVSEAVYAGGDGSVRGWKPKYLGPRTREIDCDRADCIVPTGGRFGATGSVEFRGNPVGGLWLAGFSDIGRAWVEPGAILDAEQFFDDLQVSVGGGVRYDTPIGRIRLDIAVHPEPWTDDVFLLPWDQIWNGETESWDPGVPAIWNIHFGIGESF